MDNGQFPIYQKFPGGKRAVLEFLRQGSDRPTRVAANMWANALGHIPPRFVLLIEKECRRRRIKINDDDFVSTKGKSNGKD